MLLLGCFGLDKSSQDDTVYKMRGDFRKGPFAAQSDVRVELLDRRGEPSGKTYDTATENDSGDFRLALTGGVAQFTCTGKYFDEMLGAEPNGMLKLTGIAQVPQDGKTAVHVNAITHMTALRVKRLMAGGKKFPAAAAQAESELLRELGVVDPEGKSMQPAASLDLLGGDNPHTLYLFGVSSILGQAAFDRASGRPERIAEYMQDILDTVASQLESEGLLASDLKAQLLAAQSNMDPEKAQKGMQAWIAMHNSNAVLPTLEHMVDTDHNGKPNDVDPDDDGDGVPDSIDCAPRDSLRQMVSPDGQSCVAAYGPTAVLTYPEDGRVRLVWDPVQGGSSYNLYYQAGDAVRKDSAAKIAGATPGQIVASLDNGKLYSFAVSAIYGNMETPLSPPARAVPVGLASNLTATAGSGKITLKWNSGDGAATYDLYMRAGAGVDKNDTRVASVTSPYVIDNLKDGALYSFALASVSGGSESRLGDTVSAVPVSAPSKLTTGSGDKRIVIAWDSVPGAQGYTVFYAPGDSAGSGSPKIENAKSPDTLTGLANGTRYAVRVQAVTGGGASNLSPSVWCIPMAPPGGIKARSGTSRITVTWQPAEGAAAYAVYYRGGNAAASRVVVAAPPATLPGLADGTDYIIRVASTNTDVESYSPDSVIATPMAAPVGCKAAMEDGGVDLTWTAVKGATGYSVFFRQGNAADTSDPHVSTTEAKVTVGGLSDDARYAFVVRAENASGQSDAGLTVPGMPMKPPAGLTAVAEADKVTVRWNDVLGASGYNLYYAASPNIDRSGTQVANIASPYVISNLDNGVQYTFAVEAVKQGFASPLSAPQSITYKSSTLRVGTAGFSDGIASYLSLAVDASETPYLAFVDEGKASGPHNVLRVMAFQVGGWAQQGSPALSTPYTCCNIAIGPGQMPYLAYGDGDQANHPTVKAYDGKHWTAVGGPTVSDYKAEFLAFAVDGFGIPYLAYNDSAWSGRASVKKLQGAGWANVGLPGFSTNAAGLMSLAFTGSGSPILSCGGNGFSAPALMAFDGKNWGISGNASTALARAASGQVSLAVSSANVLYAAFPDKGAQSKATVVTSNGSNWAVAGTAGFSEGATQSLAITTDKNGTPYVAFADESLGGRASVMKFQNGTWVPACQAGFSQGRANYVCIAIAASGTVYVAYQDAGFAGKAVVVKLNGP